MTSLHSRRERVLAQAVVSNYINELSAVERRPAVPLRDVRPAPRRARERRAIPRVHAARPVFSA